MKVLLASHKPLAPGQLAARAGCTQAPITRVAEERHSFAPMRDVVDNFTAKHEIIKRTEALNLNPDQRIALKTILANLNAGKHQTMLLHGGHRLRQDRSVHPSDRRGGPVWPSSDRVGSRDQSSLRKRWLDSDAASIGLPCYIVT